MIRIFQVLLLPFLLVACGTVSPKKFREDHFLQDYQVAAESSQIYKLLYEKMDRCYERKQSDSLEEGIFGSFNPQLNAGSLWLAVRDRRNLQSDVVIHLLDVRAEGSGTKVLLYSKDDLFRSAQELQKNLPKWLAGKTGRCRGNAFKGEFWREI